MRVVETYQERFEAPVFVKAKKTTSNRIEVVSCPTCGAGPGEKCELPTGQRRTEPHRDRLLAADSMAIIRAD
jgi:hypothetical protein